MVIKGGVGEGWLRGCWGRVVDGDNCGSGGGCGVW